MSTTAYDDQFVSDPEVPNPMPVFHHAVIPDALLEISRKLHSQDGRITSHPIFQVRKLREVYNVEHDDSQGWVMGVSLSMGVTPEGGRPWPLGLKIAYIVIRFSEKLAVYRFCNGMMFSSM